MSLPSSIRTRFDSQYEGMPAARLRSSAETVALERTLREHRQSYQTRISKTRRSGREFVVLLLEP